MSKVVLVGDIFNRLTVLSDTGKSNKNGRILLCQCQCGLTVEVIAGWLTSGNTQSCGCLRQETSRENGNKTRKHGHSGSEGKTPEYWTWVRIKQRCHNPNDPAYKNYGAKGITVYNGWLNDFEAFYNEIGPRPSDKHQIDRIIGTKGYEPQNIRWATSIENNRNKLNNYIITINNISKCLSEWLEEYNIPRSTFYNRIRRGWSEEAALLKSPKVGGVGSRGKRNLL